MAMETWEFDENVYCLLSTHDGFGDERVTYYELSEARRVQPAVGETGPGTAAPGPTAVTVKVYPLAEGKPPSAYFGDHQKIPFAVLKHFTDLVTAIIETQTS